MVGPFIFLDEMGPVTLAPEQGIDVPAHPHIGLATVTYLFAGEMLHRDSLGTTQLITAGAVNWMIAGRGITHSERSSAAARAVDSPLWGIQIWVALPDEAEDMAPAFEHHGADDLPVIEADGAQVRVILGGWMGRTAPGRIYSPMGYAAADLAAGAELAIGPEYRERAVYIATGQVTVDGHDHGSGRLVVLPPGTTAVVTAHADSRLMLLGGAPVGPRLIWWNFVATNQARLDAAKAAWRAGDFALPPGDDQEIVAAPADYS